MGILVNIAIVAATVAAIVALLECVSWFRTRCRMVKRARRRP